MPSDSGQRSPWGDQGAGRPPGGGGRGSVPPSGGGGGPWSGRSGGDPRRPVPPDLDALIARLQAFIRRMFRG